MNFCIPCDLFVNVCEGALTRPTFGPPVISALLRACTGKDLESAGDPTRKTAAVQVKCPLNIVKYLGPSNI